MSISQKIKIPFYSFCFERAVQEASVQWRALKSQGIQVASEELKIVTLARTIGSYYDSTKNDIPFSRKSPELTYKVIERAVKAGAVFDRETKEGLLHCLNGPCQFYLSKGSFWTRIGRCTKRIFARVKSSAFSHIPLFSFVLRESKRIWTGKGLTNKFIKLVGVNAETVLVNKTVFSLLFPGFTMTTAELQLPFLSNNSLNVLDEFIRTGHINKKALSSMESVLELMACSEALAPGISDHPLREKARTLFNLKCIKALGCDKKRRDQSLWGLLPLLFLSGQRSKGSPSEWEKEMIESLGGVSPSLRAIAKGFPQLTDEAVTTLERPAIVSVPIFQRLLEERSLCGVGFRVISRLTSVYVEIKTDEDLEVLTLLLQNPAACASCARVLDREAVLGTKPHTVGVSVNSDSSITMLIDPQQLKKCLYFWETSYNSYSVKVEEGKISFVDKVEEDSRTLVEKAGFRTYLEDMSKARKFPFSWQAEEEANLKSLKEIYLELDDPRSWDELTRGLRQGQEGGYFLGGYTTHE